MHGTGLRPFIRVLATLLPLVGWLSPAISPAQYIYLDTNGDGINSPADVLSPDGVTTLHVWLWTDRNRDGTHVGCEQTQDSLDIFSYGFVLHATAGAVAWGPYANLMPGMGIHFRVQSDSTNYCDGYAGTQVYPPGLHQLGTLDVRVLSGTPSIGFAFQYIGELTLFGTLCEGVNLDMPYSRVFGIDWFDADGVAYGGNNHPPVTAQPADMDVTEGQAAEQEVSASDPDGSRVTFSKASGPGYMTVSTLASWDGGGRGKIRLAPGFADAGEATGTIEATDGALGDRKDFGIRVADVNLPPRISVPWRICAEQGQAHTVPILATDPDLDRVAMTCAGLPGFAVFQDNGDNTATLRLAPAEQEPEAASDATITASDGRLTTSRSFSLIVAPPEGCLCFSCGGFAGGDPGGLPPVADAGGPRSGFAGFPLLMDGGRSADPEGAELNYYWDFGDGRKALGVRAPHEYSSAGSYRLALKVNDGYRSDTDTTTVEIREPYPARTLLPEGRSTVRIGSGKPDLCLWIEPADGAFRSEEIDPLTIEMRALGTGGADRIPAASRRSAGRADRDQDGVSEVETCFRIEDLRLLLGELPDGASATVRVEGSTTTGGRFRAVQQLTVATGGPRMRVSVHPNPLNPEGVLRFETAGPGFARVRLYDVRGRLVRVLLDEPLLPAGEHSVSFVAEREGPLASGLYFYLLETREGSSRGRLAVLK